MGVDNWNRVHEERDAEQEWGRRRIEGVQRTLASILNGKRITEKELRDVLADWLTCALHQIPGRDAENTAVSSYLRMRKAIK